jgi:glycerophosphoryl diester phosphodiesterase
MICLAHRGASGHEPENTMRSFAKALELGAEWLEFDVRAVEGTAIIFHDRDLMRCAKTFGLVSMQSLAKLRTYDVGKGERIPLLSEVLDLLKGRAKAQVELKGRNSAVVAVAEIERALNDGWKEQDLLVSSFDQVELKKFKELLPSIPIGLLIYGYPINLQEMIKTFNPLSLHIHLDSVTLERVRDARSLALKVFVYTVNEKSDIAAMRDLGVDGVFSNFPDRVFEVTGVE